MEFKYLKKASKTKKIGYHVNEPATIEEIEALEAQVGFTFPQAYREFLYLCGNGSCMLGEFDHEIELLIEIQEHVQFVLKKENFKIEKDYWVLGQRDGGDLFYFFYLDEGENPPIYLCDRGYWYDDEVEEGYEFVGLMDISLSKHIENLIKHRKRYGY